jgi:Fe-Mn family superoxide dismutase
VWLVVDGHSELQVLGAGEIVNPLETALSPLLAIDVCGHAYRDDYDDDKARYVDNVIDRLVDWEFAAARHAAWLEACRSVDQVP